MAVPRSPSGGVLLRRLKAMEGKGTGGLSLMLVSLSALPTAGAGEEFWGELNETLTDYKHRYDAELFEISRPDRALLIKISEIGEVGIISDLKVAVLRLIQNFFPEHFGMVDQARLLRVINLRLKLANAIKYLEHVESQSEKAADTDTKLRALHEEDIRKVLEVSKKLGHARFKEIFVRNQKIAEIKPGGVPKEVMSEYFIGMDALKKHVFADVELRGSGNLFNQLTITLDRVLIDAFDEVNPQQAKCSVNINVESVFTRAFESFLEKRQSNALAHIVFEFRQSNILQHFDEFEIAANLIKSRAGTIAIDAIFPETLGIVNLNRLHASMAKIFWRQGAETALLKNEDTIKALQDEGVNVVIARLEDEAGVKIGHDLGINLFQGFYVDDLMDIS